LTPGGSADLVETGIAQRTARIGDHFSQRLAGDRALEAVAHDVRQPQPSHIVVTAGRLEDTSGVEQLPLDVEIDAERLLVTGQEALASKGAREDATIENMHLVQWRFQMQSRAVLDAVDLAEARAQRSLTLIQDESRAPQQQRGQRDAQRYQQTRSHH
jgi:hypothetical protein